MDLDQIFVMIIVMVIWGVSNAIRKITNPDKEKNGVAKKKPGFFEILQQNLAAFEEKATDGEALDEHLQPLAQPQAEEQELETLIEIAEEISPLQKPARTGREKVTAPTPEGVIKPRPAVLQTKPMAKMSRSKLQEAVIWAEILALPVALREQ